MNISDLKKAQVLAALYNRARQQGVGFIGYDPEPMTEEQAAEILASGESYFDYLKGRVMKINLSGGDVETRLFNRDNGPNAAEDAVQALRESGSVNPTPIQEGHQTSLKRAAVDAKGLLGKPTRFDRHGTMVVVTLGVDPPLAEAIESHVNQALRDVAEGSKQDQ